MKRLYENFVWLFPDWVPSWYPKLALAVAFAVAVTGLPARLLGAWL